MILFGTDVVTILPSWMMYGFSFLFGTLVGSFLNVCIFRIPEEEVTVSHPKHSRCPHCLTPIRWFDNIPVLSYLALLGRCRSCKTPLSLQYPLVELMSGVMALAVAKKFGMSFVAFIFFGLICALIVVSFIDLAHWIIPDEISLPGILVGIAVSYWIGPPFFPSWEASVLGAVGGGGIFLSITLFYEFVLKRPGLGLGDAKLLAMLGAFFGWQSIVLIVLLGSVQGLIAACILFFLGWRKGVPVDDEAQQSQEFGENNLISPKIQHDQNEGGHAVFPVNRERSEDIVGDQDYTRTQSQSDVDAVDSSLPLNAPQEVGDVPGQSVEEFNEEAVGFGRIAIPFGPFLSLAGIEVLFWKEQIFRWFFGV